MLHWNPDPISVLGTYFGACMLWRARQGFRGSRITRRLVLGFLLMPSLFLSVVATWPPPHQAGPSLLQGLFEFLAVLAVFAGSAVAAARMLPEIWMVECISRKRLEAALDQALNDAGLDPKRTETVIRLGAQTSLTLMPVEHRKSAYLVWRPHGASKQFAPLVEALEERLTQVERDELTGLASFQAVVGVMFLLVACGLLPLLSSTRSGK